MEVLNERIKRLREEKGLSQEDLAKILGYKSRSMINKIEKGINDINQSKIKAFAVALGVSPSYLLGYDDIEERLPSPMDEQERLNKKKGVKIAVLGKVAAGIPIEAIEDILDYEEITEEMARTGEFFALQIKGDSMSPRILDGDVVIVRKQSYCESGKTAIVMVNGEDATCKRVLLNDNGITLMPLNPTYMPTFYTNEQIADLPVTIIGQVVELRCKM